MRNFEMADVRSLPVPETKKDSQSFECWGVLRGFGESPGIFVSENTENNVRVSMISRSRVRFQASHLVFTQTPNLTPTGTQKSNGTSLASTDRRKFIEMHRVNVHLPN